MRLLVTGASGLLGLNLSLLAAREGHVVTGLVHSRALQGVPFEVQQVNLLDWRASLPVMEASRPDAIIHCAALADINSAEQQPELARQMNGELPGELAAAAVRWGVPFVHISTDAVFDGQRGDYAETDPTAPLSTYARSKLAGEQAVLAANPAALIARTVFFGWSLSGTRSLAEFFVNHLRAGEQLTGFTDTYFCPFYVEDLAETLLAMLAGDLHGIYHVVSPDTLSKYDFGVRIARLFGFDPGLVHPAQAGETDRGASRSLNLTLSSEKIRAALGRPLPTVDEGLVKFHRRWQEGYPQQLHTYFTGSTLTQEDR